MCCGHSLLLIDTIYIQLSLHLFIEWFDLLHDIYKLADPDMFGTTTRNMKWYIRLRHWQSLWFVEVSTEDYGLSIIWWSLTVCNTYSVLWQCILIAFCGTDIGSAMSWTDLQTIYMKVVKCMSEVCTPKYLVISVVTERYDHINGMLPALTNRLLSSYHNHMLYVR